MRIPPAEIRHHRIESWLSKHAGLEFELRNQSEWILTSEGRVGSDTVHTQLPLLPTFHKYQEFFTNLDFCISRLLSLVVLPCWPVLWLRSTARCPHINLSPPRCPIHCWKICQWYSDTGEFISVVYLPVNELYVGEGEMTNFAIQFSFPLTVYWHLGYFDYVSDLQECAWANDKRQMNARSHGVQGGMYQNYKPKMFEMGNRVICSSRRT